MNKAAVGRPLALYGRKCRIRGETTPFTGAFDCANLRCMTPVCVFISSTCYDLLDLRAELTKYLEQHAFLVRASDDYESSFHAHGKIDSISSCLLNVEESDVIVCVLDRRYGPVTGIEPYPSLSATHAEIEHAKKHGKPIFTFVRDQSHTESEHILKHATFRPRWIEEKSKMDVARLIQDRKDLRQAVSQATSNWFDLFKNSVDLRPLILKRLLDHFPEHVGAFARTPEKIVRLYFEDRGGDSEGRIKGRFINAGNGPALDLTTGWMMGTEEHPMNRQGALLVGSGIPENNAESLTFKCPKKPDGNTITIYCAYQNASGDRYRIEVAYRRDGNLYTMEGSERFKVWVGQEWLQINP